MNKPVKLSMPNRAYQEIKRLILDNELTSNAIILEQELAELLEMSRTPVREALIRLANEGMVEVRPRHGMRVLPVSVEDMIEIYEILTALESEAAALVAEAGLNKEQLQQLYDSVHEMDDALAADDRKRWSLADERFHMLLVNFSGNQRLISMVNTFFDQSHRVRCQTLHLRPKPVNSNEDHSRVVAAIEARDPQMARETHHDHRKKSGKMLVDILRKNSLSNL